MKNFFAADTRGSSRILFLGLALLWAGFPATSARPGSTKVNENPPDSIFLHGDIYTGLPGRRAQAMAVRDGRIVAVGSDAEIQKLKAKRTQVVDLGGHFVMPGFNDAHVHLANAGFEKLNVNLTGVHSLAEMQERIAARAKAAPAGEWITGRGWDHTLWSGQRLPTRQDLDQVTGNHPAIFARVDGHISVANSAALKFAGITASTPDPTGGKIDHDAQGEPAGILRETVKDDLLARIPPPSPAQRRRALELALADAAHSGITSAQDNSQWEDFLIFEDLEREGKLTLRIAEWLPFNASLELLQAGRSHHSQNDEMLHTTMLKGFMDGSLGSRTAALLAPYADDPGNTGLARYDQAKLNQMAVERARAVFQLGFHAIGDRAVEMALNAFAEAERDAGQRGQVPAQGFRFRVEHAQITTPEQVKRFRELGVIASMQPNHLLTDMRWVEARLGKGRLVHSYAWKEFLDAGVRLAFGTDYPVEPITPFRGLYAAVTRRSEDGKQEYFPEQRLTIDQAIAAYTTGSAYAEFAEHDKGLLQPGMLADFVVLDRDIAKVATAAILKTQVLRTVVGGKAVYESGHREIGSSGH
ncbi:MAG: amidohydrolase family protein [Terriglobales bacterium]